MAHQARNPKQPREQEHSSRDERDVRARYREQVVKAGGAKVVPEIGGEPLVLPEDDAEQDRPPLAGVPDAIAVRDGSTQAIGHAGEAAPMAYDTPVPSSDDHVYAVPTEPRPFVETVFGSARRDDRAGELEHGALRRRSSKRELEEDRLLNTPVAKPLDPCGNAQGVQRSARRPGDDDLRSIDVAELCRERAPVDGGEPFAADPHAAGREPDREQNETEAWEADRAGADDERQYGTRVPDAKRVRSTDPAAEGGEEKVLGIER